MTQQELEAIVDYSNNEISQYLLYGIPIRYAIKSGFFNIEEFYNHNVVREDFSREELQRAVTYLNSTLNTLLEEAVNIREKLKHRAFCDLDLITNEIVNIE